MSAFEELLGFNWLQTHLYEANFLANSTRVSFAPTKSTKKQKILLRSDLFLLIDALEKACFCGA